MIPGGAALLIAAAGSSTRAGIGGKKEYAPIADPATGKQRSVLDLAVSRLLSSDLFDLLVVACPPGQEEAAREACAGSLAENGDVPALFVGGGSTRRQSVLAGLRAIAGRGDVAGRAGIASVLVHDGARPWASPELARRVLEGIGPSEACVPLLPLVDTIKGVGPEGIVESHPSRSSFGAAQTPQGFPFPAILLVHEDAEAGRGPFGGLDESLYTDDAAIWGLAGGITRSVEGERDNRKITYREDFLSHPGRLSGGQAELRVGRGWDIHRLALGRPLMIGGVQVPFAYGEDAHSDGDVLIHAVIDALLGAAALGDIGKLFPDTDPEWKGADSKRLLALARDKVAKAGWTMDNLDCNVILQAPKLAPHIDAMRAQLAGILGAPESAVSIKAKTAEGLGPVGEGRAIEASAIALLRKTNGH